jgi:hypothetical protein
MLVAMGQEGQIACFKGDSLGVDAKKASSCDDEVKAWAIFGRECQSPWCSEVAAGVEAPLQPQVLQDVG